MKSDVVFTVQSPLITDGLGLGIFSVLLDIALMAVAILCSWRLLFGNLHHDDDSDSNGDDTDTYSNMNTYGAILYQSYNQSILKCMVMAIQASLLLYSIVTVIIRIVNYRLLGSTSTSSRREVCTVRMLPYGVQIEEYTQHLTVMKGREEKEGDEGGGMPKEEKRTKRAGLKVRFIPREWIVDAIVKEHVMSYRVVSIIVFRILIRNGGHGGAGSTWSTTGGKRIENGSHEEEEEEESQASKSTSCLQQSQVRRDVYASSSLQLVTAFNPNKVEMTYDECMQVWMGIRDALKSTM